MRNEQQIVELAKAIKAAPKILQPLRIHELLDLIDPPQPTVDWGKAIGIYFGEKLEELELIGPLDPPDHTGCTRVVYSRLRNALYTCQEDGTNGPGSEVRVVNIYAKPDPAPIELGYEVAVARHPRYGIAVARRTGKTAQVHLSSILCKYSWTYQNGLSAVNYAWEFEDWQPQRDVRGS